ncbi:site-specific integrase [Amylibacter sp.]|nr:site-specific integrase [Amylibacter sp.]
MASFKKLNSGLWQAQVRLKKVRKSASFATKTEAKDWATVEEYKIKTAEPIKTPQVSQITVGELMKQYELEFSRKKGGYDWEQKQITKMLRTPMAALLVGDVTKAHIREWRNKRLETVQGSTVNREWNLFSHIFSMARDEYEYISVSPFTGVRRPKDNPDRDRLISDSEIEQLRVVSGFDGVTSKLIKEKVFVAFLFAIETAMRAGEICNLTWDNVNKEDRTAFLPKTKNGKSRTVALSNRAIELLGCLSKERHDKCFGLKSSQITANFTILVNKTLIENLNFHDTRHEAITRLAKKLPVLALARNTGHTDIKKLMVYYNETGAEIAKLLD